MESLLLLLSNSKLLDSLPFLRRRRGSFSWTSSHLVERRDPVAYAFS